MVRLSRFFKTLWSKSSVKFNVSIELADSRVVNSGRFVVVTIHGHSAVSAAGPSCVRFIKYGW